MEIMRKESKQNKLRLEIKVKTILLQIIGKLWEVTHK